MIPIVEYSQAQSILVQARQILVERLNDLVLQNGEAFIEDAHGNSYMDEIGTVYEQVMGRLSQVNAMIANLPSIPSSQIDKPSVTSSTESQDEPATFQLFVQLVSAGDVKAATPVLAQLLDLNDALARSSTENFRDHLAAYPDTVQRTMQLRVDLAQEQDNQVIMFLYDVFGLSSVDAILVLQHLKSNFGQAA